MFDFTFNSVIILKPIFVMLLLCTYPDPVLTNQRSSSSLAANEKHRCLLLMSCLMRVRYVQHGAQKGNHETVMIIQTHV